eukprot:376503_1
MTFRKYEEENENTKNTNTTPTFTLTANYIYPSQQSILSNNDSMLFNRRSIKAKQWRKQTSNAYNLFREAMNSPFKLAVYGYIRIMENNINFFCPIQQDVIEICCMYFYYLQNWNPLHKHSIIKVNKPITNASSDIDWEKIGQIMLDYRFLPSARLINQSLDHMESFCCYEEIHEKNFCDEICKAWSVLDDRGTMLWQVLHGKLHYTQKERRRIYDLILHEYFRLDDMTTENLQFVLIKILRNLGEIQNVNLIKMKQILLETEINGNSFNEQINTEYDFYQMFQSMKNIDSAVWESVYYELIAWKLDTETIQIFSRFVYDVQMNSIGSSGNLMQQVTACSDNDYDNDEIIEWKEYRHNLKNIFQFFAGYKVNEIKKKQLKKLLAILDMKQYWNVYLMDDISMDQFITYLCKPDVNPQISDIKNHLEAK